MAHIALISSSSTLEKSRIRCRKKFLYYFPKGFADKKYEAWERNYKLEAHLAFEQQLNKNQFEKLLREEAYDEIALRAIRIETKTNLLFSFEKMALRDAVKSPQGAKKFSQGLFSYIYGKEKPEDRFNAWTEVLASLPRKQTRVLTWPLQTVFGFLAKPEAHFFLKPNVTRRAAEKYMFELDYQSRPNWETYRSVLDFSEQVRNDTSSLKPKDYIDLQSFIWVMGSDEYPD